MAPDCSFHFFFSSSASEKVSIAVNIQGLSILFGNMCLLLTAWIPRSSIKSMAWLMEVIKRLLWARREFTNLIYCSKWKTLSISCQKETISACVPFRTDNELVTGTLSCWNSSWSKAASVREQLSEVGGDSGARWDQGDGTACQGPVPTAGDTSANRPRARQSGAGFQQRGENVRRSERNSRGERSKRNQNVLRKNGESR